MVFSAVSVKHEVRGEAAPVAPHLLVQPLRRDAVERGEIAIQQHPLPAQDEDAGLNREFGIG